eukprot:GEMP01000871.1.p1 GENE.GEMP01000871.1~~GEMP01000871.1.p1  ORF type:complete len:710 (+),score=188.25 GEMP01000871.1:59-2131(+)
MNEVINSYIEESHRSLLGRKTGPPTPSNRAGKYQSQKLPRLQQQSRTSPKNDVSVSQPTVQSSAQLAAQSVRSRAICSISEEAHEDALREIDRLMKKNKALVDELSIVTAKKLSFKTQSLRDQKELKKLTETLNTIQNEFKHQSDDIEYKSELSKDAITEITEMRDTHIREVRLLQRGLQARTDDSYRNRVNEIADLVDSVGRAALQRDQANKENSKLKHKCHQANMDIKMLQEERRKYLQQNQRLRTKLADVQRTNNVLMQPRDDMRLGLDDEDELEEDLSEEEFEDELAAFEKRYSILDEGARGLDHWVEKLHREKGQLEKRSADTSQDLSGLEKAVAQWQELNEQKDVKIEALTARVKELRAAFEKAQFDVKAKSDEFNVQLTEERQRYEGKLQQFQREAEYARSTAQGYQALSEKLQTELVRVAAGEPFNESGTLLEQEHMASPDLSFESPEPPQEGYPTDETGETPQPRDESTASITEEETAKRLISDVYEKTLKETTPEILAQQAQFAKTGELLQLEVRREGDKCVLYGHELSTGDRYTVPLDSDLVQELDPEDPWTELFTVVGISLGPPKELVLPTLVGRREVPLAPCGVWMILTVYKYNSRRYFLNGFDPQSQRLVDLVLLEDVLTSESCHVIDSITDEEVLFDFFFGRLQLFESPPEIVDVASSAGEEQPPKLRLVFNANP